VYIPSTSGGILGLYNLWRRPFYGPKEDSDHYGMEEAEHSPRYPIFPWFCKLLSTFYPRLFKDCCFIDALVTYKNKLEWSAEVDQAFQDLKTAFTTTPILIHSDFSKPFFHESDSSNYAIETVLSQKGEDERLHPVAFHTRKFTAIEINYKIHDKELLTSVDSFQE
jgi:hypothetical protein